MTADASAPPGRTLDVGAETTAAFIGRALRGPLHTPVPVAGFAEFRRRFGGLWHHSSLGPAVLQFFEHGGRNLYVVRVANSARGAVICIPATRGVLALRALEPGSTERLRASVDYDRINDNDDRHFNLTLQRIAPDSGLVVEQEIYSQLSCDQDDRRYVGNALVGSELATLQLPLPAGRPLPTTDPVNRFDPGYVHHVQPGTDGHPLSDYDLIGSAQRGTGLFALNQVEHFDILYMPPTGRQKDPGPAAVLAAELYCRRRGAMLILDPPAAWDSAAAAIVGVHEAGFASANMLSYFPRMSSRTEENGPPRAVGAALAGLLCKLDRHHGPWQALDQQDLRFRRQLVPAVELSAEESARLVREGLNVISCDGSRPASARGSVTLARNSRMNREFAGLTVRRLCLMMTGAIDRATRWTVFEHQDAGAAERVHAQVHAYLSSLAEAGAFAGDRFAVQCDAGIGRRPLDPDRGITVLLTFQPAGARDTISLTLHQTVSGCRVATTAFAPTVMRCA